MRIRLMLQDFPPEEVANDHGTLKALCDHLAAHGITSASDSYSFATWLEKLGEAYAEAVHSNQQPGPVEPSPLETMHNPDEDKVRPC